MRLRLLKFSSLLILYLTLMQNSSQAQGKIWSMIPEGGSHKIGAIFKINTDGTGYELQHDFKADESGANPFSYLTEVNGKLFGITTHGGLNNVGVLFEYDIANNVYTKKFDFSSVNGTYPDRSLTLAPNGKLYGTTAQGGNDDITTPGVLFEYDPTTNVYVKKSDDIGSATFTLTSSGKLLGLAAAAGTNGVGMVFEYDPIINVITPKFSFSTSDGSSPRDRLVEASNGKFYGTTFSGGANNKGVIFEYDPVVETCTKLFDFSTTTTGSNPAGNLIEVTAGKLYGLTPLGGQNDRGVLFEYDILNNQFTKKLDFSSYGLDQPYGSLYKTTSGRVFGFTSTAVIEYDLNNNSIIIKKNLSANGTPFYGTLPFGSLVEASNGKLYGATKVGGDHGSGTVFEFDPSTEVFSKQYDFSYASMGAWPHGKLTLANNGKLYGLTQLGGDKNQGTLFEFNPVTKEYSSKFSFDFDFTGGFIEASLLASNNGKLYGVTYFGGPQSLGTLFEYDPLSNVFSKKHDFLYSNSGEGLAPYSDLLEASNGKLYGVTAGGGALNFGVLYEYDPVSTHFTKKFDFSGQDGESRVRRLIETSPGKLHGTTISGGVNNIGTIFEYDFILDNYSIKFDFSNSTFTSPWDDLLKTSTNELVGTTIFGGDYGRGGIYSYNFSTQVFSEVYSFSLVNGSFTQGSLTKSNNDKFYGLIGGGSDLYGAIFEFDLLSGYKTIFAFTSETGHSTNGSLTLIELQDQAITFNALPIKIFGDEPYELTATATSGLPVSYTSSDTDIATINGNIVTIHAAGTVTISANQPGNFNYYPAAEIQQTLTINKADQVISFNEIEAKTFGEPAFTIIGSASSQLTVTFVSSDPTVAIVEENFITIVGAGSTTIVANQSGNANYNPAEAVEQTLTVNKADQTLSFNPIATKTMGDPEFTLEATSSSGLTVQFNTASDKVSITGNSVTILKAGSVNIDASQSGNTNYTASITISQTFCVNPSKPFITLSNNTGTLELVSSSSEGNQWHFNSVSIPNATSSSYEAEESGEYTVQVTVDNCVSVFSDVQTVVITGDGSPVRNGILNVYPNPATNELLVDLTEFMESVKFNLSIYNLLGQPIESIVARGGSKLRIDLTSYTKGQYIIRTDIESKQVLYNKFVKP